MARITLQAPVPFGLRSKPLIWSAGCLSVEPIPPLTDRSKPQIRAAGYQNSGRHVMQPTMHTSLSRNAAAGRALTRVRRDVAPSGLSVFPPLGLPHSPPDAHSSFISSAFVLPPPFRLFARKEFRARYKARRRPIP